MSPHPPPARASERADALAEEQLETLRELAKVGLELAQALRGDFVGAVGAAARERNALAAAEGQDIMVPLSPMPAFTGDIGLTFGRISRAIRLTLALQTRILRGLERPERALGEPRPSPNAPAITAVLRAAADAFDDHETERLADRDDIEALAELPFAEAVALIRRDLGVSEPSISPAAPRRSGYRPPPPAPFPD
jgi:hypothetical protein